MMLVTGATGTVGRLVIDQLVAARGKVRAVSRTPGTAGLPGEVEVVGPGILRSPAVGGPLAGVRAIFVNPAAVSENAGEFVALARRAGVRRLVVLAANNVEDEDGLQPSRFLGHRNREVEAAVVASGLEWVSLRPATFHTNALHWAGQISSGDVVYGPYAAATETPVDPRDIAAVAAMALLEAGRGDGGGNLAGRKLELTGPQALSQDRMVADIGAATGRPLTYQEVPDAVVRQNMARIGAPEGFGEAYLARLAYLLDHPPRASDTRPAAAGPPADLVRAVGTRSRGSVPAAARPARQQARRRIRGEGRVLAWRTMTSIRPGPDPGHSRRCRCRGSSTRSFADCCARRCTRFSAVAWPW